jgi:hypothetical protein
MSCACAGLHSQSALLVGCTSQSDSEGNAELSDGCTVCCTSTVSVSV